MMERDDITAGPETGYHFKVRVVERLHKLSFDEKQMQAYITTNHVSLTFECHEVWSKSKFMWQGILREKFPQVNFYLYEREHKGMLERYIVVSDVSNKKMITIYPIEFDLPGDIGKILADKLIKGLFKARVRGQKLKDQKAPYFNKKRQQQKKYEALAKKYTEKANEIRSEIESGSALFEVNHNEVEKISRVLCNSLHFERDIMNGGIK